MREEVSGLLASLKRGSKKDELPGSVIAVIDEHCAVCGKQMKLYHPCCGSPYGYKGCSCGYKISFAGPRV
jgi:hypothetical protein